MPGDDLQMWPDEHGTDGFYAAVLVAAAEEKKPKMKDKPIETTVDDAIDGASDDAMENTAD